MDPREDIRADLDLGVMKRGLVDPLPGLEIHQPQHQGGTPQIERQAEEALFLPCIRDVHQVPAVMVFV